MTIFITSDTHFGHVGVTKFLRNDGTKLRPWDSTEEMDEALVANWNSVVGAKDKVYHLGDVVINRKALSTLARLNGDKVLIKGNHDIFRNGEYMQYFRDVRAYNVIDKFVMSHIPIHPDSVERWEGNIHGHLHSNKVMLPKVYDSNGYFESERENPLYFCACVEQTNFTPISFDDVKSIMLKRKEIYE